MKTLKPVTAYYGDKAADMTYVSDPKSRFRYACMRVHDNGTGRGILGFVTEGEKIYEIKSG